MELRMSQFSADQKAVLKELREAVRARVDGCKYFDLRDTFLITWLIAQDFNLAKAEIMILESFKWRRKYRIDTILENFKLPDVLKRYMASGCIGRDKYLNPLWVIRMGKVDGKGILRSVKQSDYIKYCIFMMEETISKILENPAKYRHSTDAIIQSTLIIDMDGFELSQAIYKPYLDIQIQLCQISEANYPEFVRNIFIINAPKIYSISYAMIKPFLNERMKGKISIFGYDKKQWKAALLKQINPEDLPEVYGGTLRDPDGNPNCFTKVNMGGKVPKSYYIDDASCNKDMKELFIPNGTKTSFEFHVDKLGDFIKWNFYSEDGDIAFAVYQKRYNELLPIVPRDRVDCDKFPEEGEIRCDETGVYVVEFDNNFSLYRSKKIWYAIKIEPALTNDLNGNKF